MANRDTGFKDRKGQPLFEGDKIRHVNFYGTPTIYEVKFSSYQNDWVGYNVNEDYDLSTFLFNKAIKITNP